MLIFQCVWFHIGKCFCFALFGAATNAIGNDQKGPSKTTRCFRTVVCGRDFLKKTKKTVKKNIFGIYGCFSKIGVQYPQIIYFFIGFSYDFHHPFLGYLQPCWDPRLAPLTIEVTMILPVPSAWGMGGLFVVRIQKQHVPKQFSSRQFLCV